MRRMIALAVLSLAIMTAMLHRSDEGPVAASELGPGISACQGQDGPLSDVLFVNGSQGTICDPAALYTVEIRPDRSMHIFTIKKPESSGVFIGSGSYVVYLNAGSPNAGTITTLTGNCAGPANLGPTCFPLPGAGGTPVAIWNNLGTTGLLGSSNYFGSAIANPPKAVANAQGVPLANFHQSCGDTANLSAGTVWTLQGVISNPQSSSAPCAFSVTNAIEIKIQ